MAGEKRTLAQDFADPLRAFIAHEVRFLLVGAYALAVHGRPRATADLDLWVEATPENARRAFAAIRSFGAPLADLRERDLCIARRRPSDRDRSRTHRHLDERVGCGLFASWERRIESSFADVTVPVISKADLIANKRATGRTRDLADIESLGEG